MAKKFNTKSLKKVMADDAQLYYDRRLCTDVHSGSR